MAKLVVELSREEIHDYIPYGLICETRFGRMWNTMRRKRRWLSEFSEDERKRCSKLFSQSHMWYLVKGVPDKIQMSVWTYDLWQKLAAFCCSLS